MSNTRKAYSLGRAAAKRRQRASTVELLLNDHSCNPPEWMDSAEQESFYEGVSDADDAWHQARSLF